MKPIFTFSFILLVMISSCNKEKKVEESLELVTSTYYFIRHAEKDRNDPSDKNPHLTETGKTRAVHWSEIFDNVKFDAVYSTDYNRTKETAKPTASKNNVEITLYDPNQIDASSFLADTKGKTELVVGHSNTTPKFVNNVLGIQKYGDIDDSNNGNLYIVTITGSTVTDQLLTIN